MEIKKARPNTHGKGNNNKLKIVPPKIPIIIVFKIILAFFIKCLSKKLVNIYGINKRPFHFT